MGEKLAKLLKIKEEARAALVAKSEKSEDVAELRGLQVSIEALNSEILELRNMITELEQAENADNADNNDTDERSKAVNKDNIDDTEQRQFVPGTGFVSKSKSDFSQRDKKLQEAEKRGKDLKEGRSVTVASSSILLPKVSSNTINGTFNKTSGLLDSVDIMPLQGGESFTQPYEIDTPPGDNTAEGAAYAVADTTFGQAEIKKTKVTAYSETTEEVEKLPAAPYESVIMNGITKSVRRKITKEILTGDGTSNHLTGIFTSTTIAAATDIAIAAIDKDTLNNIIFSYGADEEVEASATLILNKADLKAFSQLRTTNGEKLHTIVTNGNNGTIDGIPFIINSAGCKAISATATVKDEYCMAYGVLSNYKLVAFSPLDVRKSDDFKFSTGQIAHRGSVFIGGNVVVYNGFVRVKKAAVA